MLHLVFRNSAVNIGLSTDITNTTVSKTSVSKLEQRTLITHTFSH